MKNLNINQNVLFGLALVVSLILLLAKRTLPVSIVIFVLVLSVVIILIKQKYKDNINKFIIRSIVFSLFSIALFILLFVVAIKSGNENLYDLLWYII